MPSWGGLRERLLSIDETNSTLAPDALTAAALIYVALPNLIFLGGWLKLPYAILALGLVLVSLWQFLRNPHLQWRQPYTTSAMLLIIATGFAWCSLGGAGHFFFANPDWIVRDTVLGDLTLTPWPPAYSEVDGRYHILRTAFGFFFPAALLGKLAGFGVVDVALYCWTAIGASLFLLLLPMPRLVGRLLIASLLVVIFFSGMDYLGIVLITGVTPLFPLRLEWWVPFSYSSLAGQMHWAPNHAIPLWLVTILFYRHWGHRAFTALIITLMPLLVIWTPFAVAGILPFLCIAAMRWFSNPAATSVPQNVGASLSMEVPGRVQAMQSPLSRASSLLQEYGNCLKESGLTIIQIIAATALTYLTIRLLTLDIAAIPGAPTIDVAPNPDRFVLKYLLFALMEFAILALLIAREIRHSQGLLWLSFTILALLPLYQYGPSNDTMLRLSTPCLVILLILTLDLMKQWASLTSIRMLPTTAWVMSIVLFIGSCTAFNEMWRTAFFHRTPPNYGVSLVEHERGEPPHYVGRLDKKDMIELLRTPALVPGRNERKTQGLVPAGSDAR